MKKLSFFLVLWLPALLVYAQDRDSLAIDKTAEFQKQIDSIHRVDSMRRVELQREIESLKGTRATQERSRLEAQLSKLKEEDSLKKITQLKQLERLRASAIGHPVNPFEDTLFYVYTRVGSFAAKDRAAAITAKIKRLYSDIDFLPDSLQVVKNENNAEIVYGDIIVMSVNEMEALWFSKTAEALATEYRDTIRAAIQSEMEENSIINIALRVAAILIIITGIYFIIRLINNLHRKVKRKAISLKDKILKGFRFKGYQLLDSDRELRVLLFLLNIGRLLIIALMLYITLPLLFSVFPWTRGIAETLIGWILTPLKRVVGGFIRYLPNLFTILVIIAVTHYVVKFLKFLAGEIESGALKISGFYPDWAKPTLNIVKFLLYVFSFIIIFPYLPGSQSPIFQGVSVFVGILFSLGSSSAIANAVAGLVITYMRPFKEGDRIKIGEITGDVIEKSLLVTRVRTIKNEDITIPNSSILSNHTVNYTTSAVELGLILHSTVTIGYDVPWKQVHQLLIDAALATPGIVSDGNRKPFVLQTSLDDFYVSYQINAFSEESHKTAAIYSVLHQNIQDKFNEAGVEILSPHYRAARDGNMVTIPASYLPADYKAPAFNVSVNKSGDENKK